MSSHHIPILLLKTKSIPNDSYEDYFSTPTSPFIPIFVPVLEHTPHVHNLEQVKNLLQKGELKKNYGGMMFTSQRAVEGFAQVVQELEQESSTAKEANGNGALKNTLRALESSMPITCMPGHCFLLLSMISLVLLIISIVPVTYFSVHPSVSTTS